jgi:hypothetical protein
MSVGTGPQGCAAKEKKNKIQNYSSVFQRQIIHRTSLSFRLCLIQSIFGVIEKYHGFVKYFDFKVL